MSSSTSVFPTGFQPGRLSVVKSLRDDPDGLYYPASVTATLDVSPSTIVSNTEKPVRP